MARLTKKEIVDELIKLNVSFDLTANYSELCKLLKSQEKSDIQHTTDEIRYSFPTVSACPRCKSTNTKAVSTQGRVQYRRCRQAVCQISYQVMGTKVN